MADKENPTFELSKFLNWIQLSPKLVLVLWLPLFLLCFAPNAWLSRLGLSEFKVTFKLWFGIGFVVTSSMLLVHLGSSAWERLSQWRSTRKAKLALHDLTPREKEILSYYIINNTRSQSLPINSGVVRVLESRLVLIRASNMSHPGSMGFDYAIQPWAWDYLRKNPHLLDGAEEEGENTRTFA